MKKTPILLFALSLMACNRPWTDQDRRNFLGGCLKGAFLEMDSTKAKSYCNCMLDKIEKRYPDAGDVKYIRQDTAVYSMGKACRK